MIKSIIVAAVLLCSLVTALEFDEQITLLSNASSGVSDYAILPRTPSQDIAALVWTTADNGKVYMAPLLRLRDVKPGKHIEEFGEYNQVLATGDFNNDGYTDVVVTVNGSNSSSNAAIRMGLYNDDMGTMFVSTLLNNNYISNRPGQTVGRDVKVADIDKDGKDDIIATISDGEKGTLLLFLGKDNYAPVTLSSDLADISIIEIDDMDGDGLLDIIITGVSDETLKIFYNDHDGTTLDFEEQLVDDRASSNFSCKSSDFNSDGYNDLFCIGADIVDSYINMRGRYFLKRQLFGLTNYEYKEGYDYRNFEIYLIDADSDGRKDLITIAGLQDGVYLTRQFKPNQFLYPPSMMIQSGTIDRLKLVDVSGDGIVDMLVHSQTSQTIYAFLGSGPKAEECAQSGDACGAESSCCLGLECQDVCIQRSDNASSTITSKEAFEVTASVKNGFKDISPEVSRGFSDNLSILISNSNRMDGGMNRNLRN